MFGCIKKVLGLKNNKPFAYVPINNETILEYNYIRPQNICKIKNGDSTCKLLIDKIIKMPVRNKQAQSN